MYLGQDGIGEDVDRHDMVDENLIDRNSDLRLDE